MPATAEKTSNPTPLKPQAVDWEAHQAEMARRKKERDAKQSVLRRALDPEQADQLERQKPTFNYTVTATFMRPNERGRIEEKTETVTVIAQNENDAWAMFCDRIRYWPSRKACNPEIVKSA